MEKKKFELDISKPAAEFKSHLDLPGNQRIIFSAPFGTGKTYFLKKYFQEQNPTVFHLYPVNYSVSSNKDIFELIKFDLLVELTVPKRGIEFDKINATLSENIFLNLNNPSLDEPFKKLLSIIPLLGKAIDIAENGSKVFSGFFKKNTLKDDSKKATKAIKEEEQKPGSIKEFNELSTFIYSLINQLKETHKTNTVLIIDDLDRIDPEHIFRLLNIFAAHFDVNEQENKFGFDQVIFVCDIDNIRRIFEKKYGQETDFSGYIDKFYSREIFWFDNHELISESIEQILLNTKVDSKYEKQFFLNRPDIFGVKILKEILIELVKSNSINLRSLLKFTENEYHFSVRKIKWGNKNIENTRIDGFIIFEYLYRFYGNATSMLSALEKNQISTYTNRFISQLLLIIDWKQNEFSFSDKVYKFTHKGINYYYRVKRGSGWEDLYYAEFQGAYLDEEFQIHATEHYYMELFYLAAKTLVDLKILK